MAWTFQRYQFSTRLQIGREEIIRPLAMGTNWQSIRIGVRFCVNDNCRSSFNNSGNWGWLLGLGVRQGDRSYGSFWDDTITDWIGGGYVGQSAIPSGFLNAWNLATPSYYTLSQSRPNGMRKSGSSYTFGTEASVSMYLVGSGAGGNYPTQYFNGAYVDITKGSSSYTITPYYCNSAANAQAVCTNAVFLLNMENVGTPTLCASGGAKTVAYTGDGLFDHLSIVHSRCWPNIEISAMAVRRTT